MILCAAYNDDNNMKKNFMYSIYTLNIINIINLLNTFCDTRSHTAR